MSVGQNSHLNQRQGDVLYLIGKGLRNAEIAQQMRLSERTIKWYVSQLFLIFDVTNRTELVGVVAWQDQGRAASAGKNDSQVLRGTAPSDGDGTTRDRL